MSKRWPAVSGWSRTPTRQLIVSYRGTGGEMRAEAGSAEAAQIDDAAYAGLLGRPGKILRRFSIASGIIAGNPWLHRMDQVVRGVDAVECSHDAGGAEDIGPDRLGTQRSSPLELMGIARQGTHRKASRPQLDDQVLADESA